MGRKFFRRRWPKVWELWLRGPGAEGLQREAPGISAVSRDMAVTPIQCAEPILEAHWLLLLQELTWQGGGDKFQKQKVNMAGRRQETEQGLEGETQGDRQGRELWRQERRAGGRGEGERKGGEWREREMTEKVGERKRVWSMQEKEAETEEGEGRESVLCTSPYLLTPRFCHCPPFFLCATFSAHSLPSVKAGFLLLVEWLIPSFVPNKPWNQASFSASRGRERESVRTCQIEWICCGVLERVVLQDNHDANSYWKLSQDTHPSWQQDVICNNFSEKNHPSFAFWEILMLTVWFSLWKISRIPKNCLKSSMILTEKTALSKGTAILGLSLTQKI